MIGNRAVAFGRFNRGFEQLSNAYGSLTRRLVRALTVVVVIYVGLIAAAGFEFSREPTGFIPEQDQDYLITVLQLPPGASLQRTEQVVKRAVDIILKTPGVEHVAPFAGLDATTFTVASNACTIFSGLPSLYNHDIRRITARSVLADLRKRLSVIQDAYVLTIPPPPVQGIGNSGGFKMMLEDRAGLGTQALVNAANALVAAANKDPSFAGVFTLLNAGSPSVYADIDRLMAEKVGLTPTDVFDTLQVYLGSQYVNDFNYLGRTYEVIVQADSRFRRSQQDLIGLKARNANGEMVPICGIPRSPIACRAIISTRRPRFRALRRRAWRPARRCTGWSSWRRRCYRPASASNGPRSPISSSRRSRRRCWCSAPPRSLSSWCWRQIMRAGSCRFRWC